MFQFLEKFDKYVEKIDAEPGFNEHLATEVRKRITQLGYLYEEIEKAHSRYMELNFREFKRIEALRKAAGITSGSIPVDKTDDSREMDKLFFKIEMWTESFYYLAGRMRTILRHASKPLPGLHSFECEGARNVRNHLLEHAEGKSSRVLMQSFGVGGEQGPTIKIEREEGQEEIFPDAGLWANAEEIRKNMEVLLDSVNSKQLDWSS